MNRRQEFIDWALKELLDGKSEYFTVQRLKHMNTFYLWVFDHLSTTHLDHVLDVEAWAIVRAAQQ